MQSMSDSSSQQGWMQIFPNPFHDKVTIQLNDFNGEEVTIRVLALDGTVLQSFQTRGPSYVLERSGMPAGVYLVEVECLGQKLIRRVVVE